MTSNAGIAYRRVEIKLTETICIKTMPSKTDKNRFTEGQIYVASINSRGNYIIDTDGGKELIITPDAFREHFKEVN